MNKLLYLKALALEIDSDIGTMTIRQYLHNLLERLWMKGEGFSAKRPFGNSSWEYYIYEKLVREKMVYGRLDSDGRVEELEKDSAQKFVSGMIATVFNP